MQQQRTQQVADHVARNMSSANASSITVLDTKVHRLEVDKIHNKDWKRLIVTWLVVYGLCILVSCALLAYHLFT